MHACRHARFASLVLGLLCVLAVGGNVPPASAAEATRACLPTVRDAWVRMAPAGMPMLGGFATLVNGCRGGARILAASSPAFASVGLHETRLVDGVSRMRAVPSLRIRPGARVVLEPGGLHLMLSQPVRPLAVGGTVPVDFKLDDGRTLRAAFEVRGVDAR